MDFLTTNDPRASSSRITVAEQAELKGLMQRGTLKVILREEIPADGNVLPGRFVLIIKSTEDGKEKFKARYVLSGHRDRSKAFMVHTSKTLKPASIRLMLPCASTLGFQMWTRDVREAYQQSLSQGSIFISRPCPEFSLDPDECLQLLKPLYGLCEFVNWHSP